MLSSLIVFWDGSMSNLKNIVQLGYGLLLMNIAILFDFTLLCSQNQLFLKIIKFVFQQAKCEVNNMENSKKFRPDPKLRLMDQVRQVMRYHHYAYRTEQTYCDWIIRYIRYHKAKMHPRNMGKKEMEAFLAHGGSG